MIMSLDKAREMREAMFGKKMSEKNKAMGLRISEIFYNHEYANSPTSVHSALIIRLSVS
jgi:hypothetical protein